MLTRHVWNGFPASKYSTPNDKLIQCENTNSIQLISFEILFRFFSVKENIAFLWMHFWLDFCALKQQL